MGNNGVTMVGIGWIAAGVLALVSGIYLNQQLFSSNAIKCVYCLASPTGGQHGGSGFIEIAAIALAAGVGILLARKKIEKKIEEATAASMQAKNGSRSK